MMKDDLKKFVSAHRSAFDRNTPDPRVWETVRRRLTEEVRESDSHKPEPRIGRRNRIRIRWAAASVLLLGGLLSGIGAYRMLGNRTGDNPNQPQIAQYMPLPPIAPDTPVAPDTLTVSDTGPAPGAQRPLLVAQSEIQVQEPAPTKLVLKIGEILPPVSDPPDVSTALAGQHSAGRRLEGVLRLAELPELTEGQLESLLQTINGDANINVRLTALNVLASRIPEQRAATLIQEVFVQQSDPSMQLQLLRAMWLDESLELYQATADRLIAITEDPLALDLVKNQAYAVLMKSL